MSLQSRDAKKLAESSLRNPSRRLYFRVKRGLDVLLAFFLAPFAIILVSFAALAIKIESKGPAFFIQERPGLHGKLFKLYKLRSMVVQTEENRSKLSDMERITNTGKVIRKLSLDELPQILNILKGEMSFVGPRPLLPEYLPLYSVEQNRRHDVLPGISGWAQVNGRNDSSWEEKFRRDVWYVDNQSLILDIRIFAMTIKNVLMRQGINAGESETMSSFEGTFK